MGRRANWSLEELASLTNNADRDAAGPLIRDLLKWIEVMLLPPGEVWLGVRASLCE